MIFGNGFRSTMPLGDAQESVAGILPGSPPGSCPCQLFQSALLTTPSLWGKVVLRCLHISSRQRSNPLGDLYALAAHLFVWCKIGKGTAKRILGRQIDGIQQIAFFCGYTNGQTMGSEEVREILDAVRSSQ